MCPDLSWSVKEWTLQMTGDHGHLKAKTMFKKKTKKPKVTSIFRLINCISFKCPSQCVQLNLFFFSGQFPDLHYRILPSKPYKLTLQGQAMEYRNWSKSNMVCCHSLVFLAAPWDVSFQSEIHSWKWWLTELPLGCHSWQTLQENNYRYAAMNKSIVWAMKIQKIKWQACLYPCLQNLCSIKVISN